MLELEYYNGDYAEEKIFEYVDAHRDTMSKYVKDENALNTILRMIKENTQRTGKVYKYAYFNSCIDAICTNEKDNPHDNMCEFIKLVSNMTYKPNEFVLNPVFTTICNHDGSYIKYKNMSYTKVYDICVIEYGTDDIQCKYINSQSHKQYEEILKDAKDYKLFILYNIEESPSTFRMMYVDMTDAIDYEKYISDELHLAMTRMRGRVEQFQYESILDIITHDILKATKDTFKDFNDKSNINIDVRSYITTQGGCLDNITFCVDEGTKISENDRIVGYQAVTKTGNVIGRSLRYPLEYDTDGLVNWDSYDKYNTALCNVFKAVDIEAVVVYSKYYVFDNKLDRLVKKLNVIINFNDNSRHFIIDVDKVEVDEGNLDTKSKYKSESGYEVSTDIRDYK